MINKVQLTSIWYLITENICIFHVNLEMDVLHKENVCLFVHYGNLEFFN